MSEQKPAVRNSLRLVVDNTRPEPEAPATRPGMTELEMRQVEEAFRLAKERIDRQARDEQSR